MAAPPTADIIPLVVTEIVPATNKAALAVSSILTNVYVLTGKVDVQELRGGVPVGPVFSVAIREPPHVGKGALTQTIRGTRTR